MGFVYFGFRCHCKSKSYFLLAWLEHPSSKVDLSVGNPWEVSTGDEGCPWICEGECFHRTCSSRLCRRNQSHHHTSVLGSAVPRSTESKEARFCVAPPRICQRETSTVDHPIQCRSRRALRTCSFWYGTLDGFPWSTSLWSRSLGWPP